MTGTIVSAASKRLAGIRPPHIDEYRRPGTADMAALMAWAKSVSNYLTSLGEALEVQSQVTDATQSASKYTIANASVDRAFDADSTSVEELADVLATLIGDVKA